MNHRKQHPLSFLSGYLWTGRIEMYFVAVFIVAMAVNWGSITALGAAIPHLEATSTSIEAVTTSPDGIVEITHGAGNPSSCVEDNGAPWSHPISCSGCCLFMICGCFIAPSVAITDYPDVHAAFFLVAITTPHKLLFPPAIRPPILPFSI